MLSSLRARLIVSFLFVSLLGSGIAFVLMHTLTINEFGRLRAEQATSDFYDWATAYYAEHGSLEGFDAYLRGPDGPGRRPPIDAGVEPEAPEIRPGPPDGIQPRARYLLVDLDGIAQTNAAPYYIGERIPDEVIQRGLPVEADGVRLGTLVDLDAPGLNPRELAYLERTDRALLIASLASASVAIIAGVLLARGLSKPLMQVSHALKAVVREVEPQPLDDRFRGEIGELVRAFNRMSADLARANSLRRQMTADIAHELRSPIAVINGYLEGMRDGSLPPTPERYDAIYEETQHLRLLIDDLRTLSLADAGELPLRFEQADPADLLADIQRSFAIKAKQAGVTFTVQAVPDLPPLRIDRTRIIQVLTNLLNNALRYTPADGSITLEARHTGRHIELRVTDTGKGIPPEKLPNLFQRFYRVENDREQEDGQTGLGLAIAKTLVEMHGGSIHAESKGIGHGTTFRVSLPI